MRLTLPLIFLTALAISDRVLARNEQRPLKDDAAAPEDQYLIELGPGETRWVTEDEKWALRRVSTANLRSNSTDQEPQDGLRFMDITETPDLGAISARVAAFKPAVTYPDKPQYQKEVAPLMQNLSKSSMRENLEKFTSFHTRYYKSSYGRESAEWLMSRINASIVEAGADKYGAFVKRFPHAWGQPSLIAQIPGKSNKTVVVGAHQDSINLFLPSVLSAPGADDDGSGTVTILEALRVLLKSTDIIKGKGENTIEFHWYSAEEGGLLGSQAVFHSYEQEGRDVKAMLQQDMTGFVQRTLDAGKKESVGIITDFVDVNLTEFIKKVVLEVSHPRRTSVQS